METFENVFIDKKKNILIPALQRDYVQGGKSDVIIAFLKKLLAALKGENSVDLNYIYGAFEKDAFVPIDGQQRLITLWLLHLYLFCKQRKINDFPVELHFASREFADDFSIKLKENLGSVINSENLEINGEQIEKRITNTSWFLVGWKQDTTVQNMLKTLTFIAQECTGADIYIHFENITFSFYDIKTGGLTDDVYIKMNGRGRPLSYFENLKSYMDEKVVKHFGENDKITQEWREKIDNEWTDFFWENRSDRKNGEIDEEQTRFFYNLLRIFWAKKGKKGFVNDENKKDLSFILEIGETNDIENEIFSRISKEKISYLPLYILEKTELFSKDFFVWAVKAFDGICNVSGEINTCEIEFDFDVNKTHCLCNRIFFSHESRKVSIVSAIIDYCLFCKESKFHDWLRFTRNVLCNIDSPEKTICSIEKLARQTSEKASILDTLRDKNLKEISDDNINDEILNEEIIKAKLLTNSQKWSKSIYILENNRYFTGKIKFMFDFLGDSPDMQEFDNYATVMNDIFSKKKEEKDTIDINLLSRALLCFTTDNGYGYQIGSNWSFLKLSKGEKNSWKRYINDSDCNNDIKELVSYIIKYHNWTVTNEVLDNIIKSKSPAISDWRKFFIAYKGVWDYMNKSERYCRRNSNFDIGLVKGERYGEGCNHAELRSYCLYLDYKENECNLGNGWKSNFYEREHTCLYFEKEISNKIIAIDAYYEVGKDTEDNYKLEIFLRPFDNESEGDYKVRSQDYLKKYLGANNYYTLSDRGYQLKLNYSKKDIKKAIDYLLEVDFLE
ncbi:MAG: DUF262 domain-containing protein [Treponema sp.]|nr:DUF262 domain-containing protein [Treponema sp.]